VSAAGRDPAAVTKLAPSILSCDFGRLAEEIAAVEEGGADWIHVDVMDGHFVPNITIGPVVAKAARRATELPLDVHLMIERPHRYLEAFADAGADILTVHQEACRHLHRTVERIRDLGMRPGVALNPATPLETVREVIADIDLLLVMSVNPGFGGQAFIPATTDKLRRAASAGAAVLVAGSAVYGHASGPAAGVRAIRAALDG
jgi:ribulose-phosphate 3-epimerase